MRFRFTLALLVSIIFIGTALWYRFIFDDQAGIYVAEITPVENTVSNRDLFQTLTGTSGNQVSATSSLATQTLNNADLFGRDLFIDYVNLIASGDVTGNDLDMLAEQYVSRIPNLHQPLVVTMADLKIVPDSKTNFQNYSDAFVSIYNSYTQKINKAHPGNSIGGLDPAFYVFVSAFSNACAEIATNLRMTPIPASLATLHRDLINNYLSNSLAMSEIANRETDPVAAFAGLISLNQNLDKESLLIDQINKILVSNGI